MSSPVALSVKDLRKVFQRRGRDEGRELIAVAGISFEVQSGECFGLLGPNGAGKSTSMRCITGFYEPTQGQVEILGIDVHKNPKQARASMGVCSQEDNLDTDFNVVDQLTQFASFFGIPRKDAELRAKDLLERFGLTNKRHDLVEALSGGMRRRLQVARSLINQPKLLILDEPTTGLDPEARRVLWDILVTEREAGLAILLSTHYMDEAERLCDRVAIIDQGRILACAPPRELIAQEMGTQPLEEEIRPGVRVTRMPNLEDVYLKLTGKSFAEAEDKGAESGKGEES
jgi:lipooligosaccharide transport system ATP-binding protein